MPWSDMLASLSFKSSNKSKPPLSQLTSRHSRPLPWPPMPHKSQWRSSQHSGSAFWLLVCHQIKARIKTERKGLQKAVDSHRLPCFSAMIIQRGGLWWWQQEHSQILLEELSNQHRSLPKTKKFPITGKITEKWISMKSKYKKEATKTPKGPCGFLLESTNESYDD